MSRKLLQPEFVDNPLYERVGQFRLQTLSDYLEQATIYWALRYDVKLPILDEARQADIKTEMSAFTEWLTGDVDALKVIDGGRKD